MQTEYAKRSTEIMTTENLQSIFTEYPDVGDFLIYINTPSDEPMLQELQYNAVCRKFMEGCFDQDEIIRYICDTIQSRFYQDDLTFLIDSIIVEYNLFYLNDRYYYGFWHNGMCYGDRNHTVVIT